MRSRWLSDALLWGVFLVAGGIVILLNNFDLFEDIDPLVWAALFGVVGLGFLIAYVVDRRRWIGSLVPAFTLLGLAAVVYLGGRQLVSDAWLGTIFLASIGLGFWLSFLVNRDQWWAVIPGGTLWVLAVLAFLSESSDMSTNALGGVLFIGLGLTLGLLYLLRSARRPLGWAAIPGMALFLFGLIVYLGAMGIQATYWPLLLIFLGVGLLAGQVRAARPAPVAIPPADILEPIRPEPIEPAQEEEAAVPVEGDVGMVGDLPATPEEETVAEPEIAAVVVEEEPLVVEEADEEPLIAPQVITPPAAEEEQPWWKDDSAADEITVEGGDAQETQPWMSEVEAEPLEAEDAEEDEASDDEQASDEEKDKSF